MHRKADRLESLGNGSREVRLDASKLFNAHQGRGGCRVSAGAVLWNGCAMYCPGGRGLSRLVLDPQLAEHLDSPEMLEITIDSRSSLSSSLAKVKSV
jgi:hypothetical protein